MMSGIHYMRAWFARGAATMRFCNRMNRAAIGNSEQEVMDFTGKLESSSRGMANEPEFSDYVSASPNPDSLLSLRSLDSLLEQLKSGQ